MANSVCHAVPDPVTGNYRFKLGRGVLKRIGERAYKHNFQEMSLKPRPIMALTIARLRAASPAPPTNVTAWAPDSAAPGTTGRRLETAYRLTSSIQSG